MSAHGSNASQAAHFAESLLVWVIGFLIWTNWVGVFGGLVFTVGKEGSHIYSKVKRDRPIKGDLIDLGVHLAGFIVPALLAWAV